MSAGVELRWIISLSASAAHAADLARRGEAADTPLVQAAAQPAQRLGAELRAAGLDEQAFWDHLLPLSAEVESNRQLVEAVLGKVSRGKDRSARSAARLAGRVADLEAAVARAAPGLVEELTPRAERLRAAWDERGGGLLERIGLLTDPRVVVAGAKVAPLRSLRGDYASAHLPYNLARIELGAEDSAPLPELVRLAWLVSQLNLDLAVFSEEIPAARRSRLATLAMLPAVLAVAEEVGLVTAEDVPLKRAVGLCRFGAAEEAGPLEAWWESYLEVRPAWNVALAALDRML